MINWAYMIASMLLSAKASADAEEAGNKARNVAGDRIKREQDNINAIHNNNLQQYANPEEKASMDQIIADKVAPAVQSIDSTTNFQDVDKFGSAGSVKNTAYKDALTGAIADVANKAKTKASMLANVKAPTHMRQDQSMKTADAIQRQGVIGKNANDYFNNVSQLEINHAYKPDQTMMLLSKALGAYATAGGGGDVTGVTTSGVAPSTASSTGAMFSTGGRPMALLNGTPVVEGTAQSLLSPSQSSWYSANPLY